MNEMPSTWAWLTEVNFSPVDYRAEAAVFATACAGFALFYAACRPFCAAAKQRSYVMACLSSTILSSLGMLHLVVHGLGTCGDTRLSRATALTFLAYLLTETVIGVLDFMREIEFLTGWVHHVCYAYILYYVWVQRLSMSFAPFLFEEIPTVLMALGRLRIFRTDLGFGLSFLATRLCFHGYGAYVCLARMTCLRAYAFFLLATGSLHCYWGVTWIRKTVTKYCEGGETGKGTGSTAGADAAPELIAAPNAPAPAGVGETGEGDAPPPPPAPAPTPGG